MPKINVYLPDALASAVKEAGVPVSTVCQAALADAVERIGRTRLAISLLRDPGTSGAAFSRLADGLQRRMTPRLVGALATAATKANGEAKPIVSSLDLLRGLIEGGDNLAVRLLVQQGVDLEDLAEACVGDTADEEAPPAAAGGVTLFSRMTMPARSAGASALEAVVELGHNYLGCEHLLLGLAASDCRASALLAGEGLQAASLRQALVGAVAGVLHERSASTAPSSGAVADLTRRIEAIERQLSGGVGA